MSSILDERAAHDDLRNQDERDDVGRRLRIGHERGNDQAERDAAHRGHEHDTEIDPKHPANLEDVIADQDKKDALDEGENSRAKTIFAKT